MRAARQPIPSVQQSPRIRLPHLFRIAQPALEDGRATPSFTARKLAILILFGVGIAGALAFRLAYSGPLDVDRLPWDGATLEAMPGLEAQAIIEPWTPDSPRESFSHWESFPFGLVLLLGVPLLLLLRSRHAREAVVNPSALVASFLCLIALGGIGNAAHIVAGTGNWDSPPFLRWRTSPAELLPWLWLLAAAAGASVFALWRSLRCPTSNGLVLAASALFSAAWAFALVDALLLTQMRAHDSSQPSSLLLPMVMNHQRADWDSPCRITVECDHQGQCRLVVLDQQGTSEQTSRHWSGSVDDSELLSEIDEVMGVMASRGDPVWYDCEVFLALDARLTFGRLRPALKRLRAGGVEIFWLKGAPRVEGGLPPLALWTLRNAPPLTPGAPLDLRLVKDEAGEGPAKALVKGKEYENVAALAKASSFEQKDMIQGSVGDDVPWHEFVHAIDALLGAVIFRL